MTNNRWHAITQGLYRTQYATGSTRHPTMSVLPRVTMPALPSVVMLVDRTIHDPLVTRVGWPVADPIERAIEGLVFRFTTHA